MKGTILLSFSILAVMVGITNIDGANITSSLISLSVFPLIITGIILFVWLIKYENNIKKLKEDPIFYVRLLKQRQYQVTLILGLFSSGFLADKIGAKLTITILGAIGVTGFLIFPFFVTNGFVFVITSVLAGVGLGMMLGAPLNH